MKFVVRTKCGKVIGPFDTAIVAGWNGFKHVLGCDAECDITVENVLKR